MSTIAQVHVSSEDFVLEETLIDHPHLRAAIHPIVPYRASESDALLWTTRGDFEVVKTALRADPSLAEVEHMATFAEPQRWLFQVRWGSKAEIPSVLTTAETNMLSAQTKSAAWELRLFVSDRQHLSQPYEACDANDFEIKSIRELCEDDIIAGTDLTLKQYQALITAYQLGYYDIPRRVSTTKIAEVLDITHQALSERLSRGHRNLIRSILQYDNPLAASTRVVRCLKSE